MRIWKFKIKSLMKKNYIPCKVKGFSEKSTIREKMKI